MALQDQIGNRDLGWLKLGFGISLFLKLGFHSFSNWNLGFHSFSNWDFSLFEIWIWDFRNMDRNWYFRSFIILGCSKLGFGDGRCPSYRSLSISYINWKEVTCHCIYKHNVIRIIRLFESLR